MTEPDVLERHADSDTLFVAFGGVGANLILNIQPFEFLKTIERIGAAAVFVRDRKNLWYQAGVTGLGDTIDSLIDFTKSLKGRYRRIIGIGNSMGGYAAMLCGALAGFNDVIAISPQTFIDMANIKKHGENRWMKCFNEIAAMDKARYLDLDAVLSGAGAATRHHVLFGGLDKLDGLHARRVGSHPGVRLLNLTRCAHATTAAALRAEGTFDALINVAMRGGCLDSFFAGYAVDRSSIKIEK